LPSGQTIFIGGQPLKLPVEPVLRLVALGVSLAIAAATGGGMMVEWPTLALFWYAPRTAGGVDPIFGKPLNFFLFTLPAWQLLAGWLLTLAVITCVLAVFFILVTGGARAFAGRRSSYVRLPWHGLSITFAVLLLVLAMRVYLGRFERLFDDHTIFGGVTYTDAHVTLTGMLVRGLLSRPSSSRLVRQQLYRETERTGSRAALYRPQHRTDAPGLRIGPSLATRVSG